VCQSGSAKGIVSDGAAIEDLLEYSPDFVFNKYKVKVAAKRALYQPVFRSYSAEVQTPPGPPYLGPLPIYHKVGLCVSVGLLVNSSFRIF
jgi:hypothetical protein